MIVNILHYKKGKFMETLEKLVVTTVKGVGRKTKSRQDTEL